MLIETRMPTRSSQQRRRHRYAVVAWIVLFSLFAPAHASVFDRDWRVYKSAHFTLYSDGSERNARRYVHGLELLRSVVLKSTGIGDAPEYLPVNVFVFERRKDFLELAPDESYVGFMFPTLRGSYLVIGSRSGALQVAHHEYVHHLLRQRKGTDFPVWLDEGLAEYFSTVDERRGDVVIGEPPTERALTLLEERQMPLHRLILATSTQGDEGDDSTDRFYATAWLFVHFVQLGHFAGYPPYESQLNDYLLKINRGVSPLDAFAAAFGDATDQLDMTLNRYRKQSRLPTFLAPAEQFVFDRNMTESDLNPTERHQALADLFAEIKPEQAIPVYRTLLAEAANDSSSVRAALLSRVAYAQRKNEDVEGAAESINRAVALDATGFAVRAEQAAVLLAQCRQPSDAALCQSQREQARSLLNDLHRDNPDDPDVSTNLSYALLLNGELAGGIDSLMAAYHVAPWSVQVSYLLGEAFRAQGNVAMARRHLQRAVSWGSQVPTMPSQAAASLATLPDAPPD